MLKGATWGRGGTQMADENILDMKSYDDMTALAETAFRRQQKSSFFRRI